MPVLFLDWMLSIDPACSHDDSGRCPGRRPFYPAQYQLSWYRKSEKVSALNMVCHGRADHERESAIPRPYRSEETDRPPGGVEEHLGLFVLRRDPHPAAAAMQVK